MGKLIYGFFFVVIFIVSFIFGSFMVHGLVNLYKVHPDQTSVDLEFDNVYTNMQPRVVLRNRNPITTDQNEQGTLWFNTTTNKLLIRKTTSWNTLN